MMHDLSGKRFGKAAQKLLTGVEYKSLQQSIEAVRTAVKQRTAWRIEGTLREYPKFAPVNLWFDYPVHHVDDVGSLQDIQTDAPVWKQIKSSGAKKTPTDRKKERLEKLETAYEALSISGEVRVKDLAEYMDATKRTVLNYIDENPKFERNEGIVKRVPDRV